MNYYNLDTQQSIFWREHKEMVIVVPLKEQPPEGWKPVICGLSYCAFSRTEEIENDRVEIKFPYPLGSNIGLRKTWGICLQASPGSFNKYLYKADEYCGNICLFTCFAKWRSAQSMPVEAIEDWGEMIVVRVDRVQTLTLKEILKTGIKPKDKKVIGAKAIFEFTKDWFNRRYSRTAKKWTWDDNPYCEIFTIETE